MEIAGLVVQLVECMSPSIGRRWKDHRHLNRNMHTLKQRLQELNSRKSDVESKLASELVQGETEVGNEVKNWLESVAKITDDVHGIEEKVEKAKFFSRAGLGKIVIQKIAEVEELHSKAQFPDGLVLPLPRRGNAIPTTSTLGGETTFKRKMDEIWESLLSVEVTKVGVYGMGGIGKTTALEHIHNRLLEDGKDKFENVIWVTVSKDTNILSLQEKISSKLVGSDILANDQDIKTRAAKLHAKLTTIRRYVLILDDLWESYTLEEVGIPEPTSQDGCKLIVTTRSHEICRVMGYKPIAMELLSEEEALDMFLGVVGYGVLTIPNLEAIVKEVVRECACLPLAVVVIAGSLKGIDTFEEWVIALEDLRDSTKTSLSSGIFERLKFSYDRLGDNKKLQECLLYCALYPEDHPIERRRLIEHLIAEGIIEERKTRKSEISYGQVMLNKLVNVCLLNDATDPFGKKYVKMHDLVRDMALQITSDCPRYLVKAGLRLRCIPDEENWKDDLAKVSLMHNNLVDIPSCVQPPNCPGLSTLLLCRSSLHSFQSDNFFLHMKGLSVLDLSETKIESLPNSVLGLTALTALFLYGCRNLKYVPSLAKLENLRLLELQYTGIRMVPEGLEKLIKLRYLNLYAKDLREIPAGILCNLTHLQHLSFYSVSLLVIVGELGNLMKLETLKVNVYADINTLNECVRSLEQRRLVSYELQFHNECVRLWEKKKFLSSLLRPIKSRDLYEDRKVMVLTEKDMCESNVAASGEHPLLLPNDVEVLAFHECKMNAGSLCELTSFKNVTNLRKCIIKGSDKLTHAFSYSSCLIPLLQSLESLELQRLPDLRGLISWEKGISPALLPQTFSALKCLDISACRDLKKLLISFLPNLETLRIHSCENLEELSTSFDDGASMTSDNEEERHGGESISNEAIITLPKLRELALRGLPKLRSIALIADALESITIRGSGKNLRRITPLDRAPCPSSLKRVNIDDELWASLEWDHPDAKNAIQSMRTS